MAWIADLISEGRNDLLLNIVAGVPFLIFDLVIITTLLPTAIRWWDERQWRATRSTAINHLLHRYADVDDSLRRFVEADRQRKSSNLSQFGSVTHDLIMKELDDHAIAMDGELQTALPVLGPEYSKDVLILHYEWKRFLRSVRNDASYGQCEHRSARGIETSYVGLCQEASDLGILHHRLAIKYASDEFDLRNRRNDFSLLFNQFPDAYAPIARGFLARKTSINPDELWQVRHDTIRRQRWKLVEGAPVRPVIRRGLINWLRRSQMVPPVIFTADERREAAEQWTSALMERAERLAHRDSA